MVTTLTRASSSMERRVRRLESASAAATAGMESAPTTMHAPERARSRRCWFMVEEKQDSVVCPRPRERALAARGPAEVHDVAHAHGETARYAAWISGDMVGAGGFEPPTSTV